MRDIGKIHLLQIAVDETRQQKISLCFLALQTITLDTLHNDFFPGYQRQMLEIDWRFVLCGNGRGTEATAGAALSPKDSWIYG